MSLCPRPIDPIDAEALAAGAQPLFASDAAEHARQCDSCGRQVSRAASLAESLRGSVAGDLPAGDLAERVMRLRPFSRRERRDFLLWRGACGLAVAVFFAGLALLTLPGITFGEQVGLGVAAVAPLLMLWEALVRALAQTAAAAPSGLEALSQTLRQQQALGLAALALLVPVLLGLRRAVSRARR